MAYEKESIFKRIRCYGQSVFFMKRRQVLKALGISAAHFLCLTLRMPICLAGLKGTMSARPRWKTAGVQQACRLAKYLPLTPADKVSGYNNFYEFGWIKPIPLLMLVA